MRSPRLLLEFEITAMTRLMTLTPSEKVVVCIAADRIRKLRESDGTVASTITAAKSSALLPVDGIIAEPVIPTSLQRLSFIAKKVIGSKPNSCARNMQAVASIAEERRGMREKDLSSGIIAGIPNAWKIYVA